MNRIRIVLALAHAAVSSTGAMAAACRPPVVAPLHGGPAECRCGDALRNVTLTTPRKLVLRSICALRSDEFGSVELERQRVDLDRYDKRGNYFTGTFVFGGELRLRGRLRYQPSDGGDYFFTPHASLLAAESAFAPHLRVFNFPAGHPHRRFTAPTHLRKRGCAQAEAVLHIQGIEVLIDDSDAAGAYAVRLHVRDVSDFQPCQDQPAHLDRNDQKSAAGGAQN